MRFCTKCGKENSNNSNFCQSCGNNLTSENGVINEELSKPKTKKGNSLKYILIIFGVLLLLGGGYFWKTTKDKENNKNEFMKKYNESIALISKGNIDDAQKLLETLKDKDIYDEVDINNDLKMIGKLEDIEKEFLNGSDNLENQIEKFKEEFNGKYDKFKLILDNLLLDYKEYNKYLEKIKEIKGLINNQEFEKSKKELVSLKEYSFKIDNIKDKINTEIDNLLSEVESEKKIIEEKKQKEANELEELKKKRPIITEPTGLGGMFTPEYDGQPMVTLREDASSWIPAVAKRMGVNNINDLEISYFHDSAAAVYYRDKGIAVVKLNPYRRSILIEGSYKGTIDY